MFKSIIVFAFILASDPGMHKAEISQVTGGFDSLRSCWRHIEEHKSRLNFNYQTGRYTYLEHKYAACKKVPDGIEQETPQG